MDKVYIKASELKIGNITHDLDKTPEHVITASDIFIAQKHEDKHKESLWQPIPLDEEWLLRMGFENDEPECWTHKMGLEFFTVNTGSKIPNHLNFNGKGLWASFKHNSESKFYVHEFQNLFHAIFNMEIEITPKK